MFQARLQACIALRTYALGCRKYAAYVKQADILTEEEEAAKAAKAAAAAAAESHSSKARKIHRTMSMIAGEKSAAADAEMLEQLINGDHAADAMHESEATEEAVDTIVVAAAGSDSAAAVDEAVVSIVFDSDEQSATSAVALGVMPNNGIGHSEVLTIDNHDSSHHRSSSKSSNRIAEVSSHNNAHQQQQQKANAEQSELEESDSAVLYTPISISVLHGVLGER